MKKMLIVLAIVSGMVICFSGLSNAGCTLGVRDCRTSTTPGVCYWWECQQTGSETQMIFLGIKCTCPGNSKLEVAPKAMAAQLRTSVTPGSKDAACDGSGRELKFDMPGQSASGSR